MTRNAVGWFEIYVDDMARARAFYEAVFQRTLTRLMADSSGDGGGDAPGMEMWAFQGHPDTAGAAGALVRMPGFAAGGGGTLVYFSCADCAVEAARAAAHGGRIFKDKVSIGQYGHIALVHDTEGNLIGLHSMG